MATSQQQQQEDDEDDIDPIKILLPDEIGTTNENGLSTLCCSITSQHMQQHFLHSTKSALLIRQLPSQGLSFQLWPAATTLVNLLDRLRCHPSTCPVLPTLTALSNGSDPRPLKILELGSGTGLVGIAAAVTLGAIVTVTDLPHVIPNLQFNVEANATVLGLHGATVHVAPLRWGEQDDVDVIGRDFDLVLASDVVYHDHLFEPLIKTLRLLLLAGNRGWCLLWLILGGGKRTLCSSRKLRNCLMLKFFTWIIRVKGLDLGLRFTVLFARAKNSMLGNTCTPSSCLQWPSMLDVFVVVVVVSLFRKEKPIPAASCHFKLVSRYSNCTTEHVGELDKAIRSYSPFVL